MASLFVLLGCAFALMALGAVARVAPRRVPALRAAICLAGVAAALAARDVAVLQAGLVFGVDGLSALILAALFLIAACGALAPPVILGALALAVLAADGVGLALCLSGALLAGAPAESPGRFPGRIIGIACLVAALLLLSWHGPLPDLRFAGIRALPPEGLRASLLLVAALGAAACIPLALPPAFGGLLGLYLVARLLLDLAGPVTPGWWGVATLALGAALAVRGARRAAASDDLADALAEGGGAALGIAMVGLAAAMLARGADLLPLGAMALSGAMLQVLAWAAWGGLLTLCAGAIRDQVGGTALARLGGLIRLAPATGLALLIGLLSMAAAPLSAGFAGLWMVLQAVLGAARFGGGGPGGVALLMLVAGAVCAIGLAVALLAAAGVRLAGVALLGPPRTAKAAAATEPTVPTRLAMGGLALAVIALGLCPWLGLIVIQPGVRLLSGGAMTDTGPFVLASATEAPGYTAPALALLLIALLALAGWIGRGPAVRAAPWNGGLAVDGAGRGNTWPIPLIPDWRSWRPLLSARAALVALALILAAALGWAAR